MQKEHTYTVDGLILGGGVKPGGLKSGILWYFKKSPKIVT